MDELEFVAWLRDRAPRAERTGPCGGIGDDMGVVETPGGTVLFSSDMLLDGVHFDTRAHALDAIGRKSVNCALSDCAAMAACPKAVTVSLALPRSLSLGDAQTLMEGVFAAAAVFDVSVCGGDTTRWSSPLAIDVSVVAVPYPGMVPISRRGARTGDALLVTGSLGGSLLGRHMTFVPRVRESKILAETFGRSLHAMIDVTDGLSLDLWRLCESSGTGALLRASQLESAIHPDAVRAGAIDGRDALSHALTDGEDFELLLAVDSGAVTPDCLAGVGCGLVPIGAVTGAGLSLEQTGGDVVPLSPQGFVH